MLRLSRRLTSNGDLRRFAIYGLEMEAHEVQKHLQNHPHDISTAAINLLSEWRNSQSTGAAAVANLRVALERVKMAAFIEEIQ